MDDEEKKLNSLKYALEEHCRDVWLSLFLDKAEAILFDTLLQQKMTKLKREKCVGGGV